LNQQPENKGLPENLYKKIITINESCAYHQILGIRIKSLQPGVAVLTMTVQKEHINPQGFAHGGASFSLIDTAMGMSVRSLNRVSVAIEGSINYLQPAKPGDSLTAVGKIVRQGKNIMVAQAEIVSREGDMIAFCKGTYYIKGKVLEELD